MPGKAGEEERYSMSRMDRHRITRKLASIGLAMAVTMSLMPVSVGSAYAEDGTTEYLAAAQDDVIAEDVSAAEASLDLEETLTAELPDDTNIESIDIETEDFAASDEDILSSEDILDISVEEDAGLEEDGIIDDAVESVEAEETEEEMLSASSEENASEEDDSPGSGNVEIITDPVLLEKMGIRPVEDSMDPDGLIQAADSTIDYYKLFDGSDSVPASAYKNISITQSGSTVRIKGKTSDSYYIYQVGVDGKLLDDFSSGNYTSIDYPINMNNFPTGYHTVMVSIYKGNRAVTLGRRKMVSNTITDRPNSNGVFDVYSSYFNYYPYGSFGNSAGTLYMEYSANGGRSWQRSGYMKYNLITTASQQGYKIGGLMAKTTYLTRIRYGTYVTYSKDNGGDDKSYFFGGPVLNTTTIKTGSSSKPKIKSVELKATKVKYHKLRWPGYYNVVGGSVFWHNSYVEKFYTAKVKVTVKLKKKPGTAGVFISLLGQTKWVKGNKKKYTATFTPTYNYWVKNPHSGKYKLHVNVYSGQNSSWGGYSPVYSKKKKVR